MVLAFPRGLRASLACHEVDSLSSWVGGGSGCIVTGWQDLLSGAGDFCLGECLTDDVFVTSLGMSPQPSGLRSRKSYPSSVLGRFSLWFSALSLIIWSSETAVCKYVYKYIHIYALCTIWTVATLKASKTS